MKAMLIPGLAITLSTMALVTSPIHAAESEAQASLPAVQMDVPPPPPGPYMSTALQDRPAFSRKRAAPREGQLQSPFFKSDMPWPQAQRMPKRWMPDEGYQFAPPSLPPAVMQPNRQIRQQAWQQPAWGELPPPGSRPAWGKLAPPRTAEPGRAERQQARPSVPERGQAPRPWLPLDGQRGW